MVICAGGCGLCRRDRITCASGITAHPDANPVPVFPDSAMRTEIATQTRVEFDAQVMLDEMTAFTFGGRAADPSVIAAKEYARKRLAEAEAEMLSGPADPQPVDEIVFERRAAASHDIDAMARRELTAEEIERYTGMSVSAYDEMLQRDAAHYADDLAAAAALAGGI